MPAELRLGPPPHRQQGFTLVELMIVVAIIGILAAIAIPNLASMQYRAKRAELAPNIDGIKTTELAYEAAFDKFITQSTPHPTSSPGKAQLVWTSGSAFDSLGWAPDGKVRGAYSVTTLPGDIVIVGICDVDGDGVQARFTASKSTDATMTNATQDVY